ncbi:MAG: glycoside hydrolase family 1 protein [Candidatus Marinimicrobia bacterium]|nr:glycoside hydrolase family 1 protein [Candidatus Neomarinimicrobiota bacterium]
MKKDNKNPKLVFPKGFLWGAATAAHQVEGNNKNNDWWEWEKRKDVKASGIACDHYHRFKEDFALAKELNHNAHRFSIEWSRIEPEEGKWNDEAVKHYQNVLQTLKEEKMKTFVSLYHVTLPLWFAKKGGFEKKENIEYFKRFCLFAVNAFTDKVDFWVTINEPETIVAAGYLQGLWPPQKKNKLLALRVYRNLALAHKEVYQAIKNEFPSAQVGAVINMPALHYHGNHFLNRVVPSFLKILLNHSFYRLTGETHDFLGLNYYLFHNLRFQDLKMKITKKKLEKTILLETSDLGWQFYPQGIYEALMSLKKYHLPIYITENGVADAKDKYREKFIINHLQWVHQAIQEGVDVRGYLYWSLIDNFEWAFGFKPRFGLIEINYKTQKRKIRKSAYAYAKICQENAIIL